MNQGNGKEKPHQPTLAELTGHVQGVIAEVQDLTQRASGIEAQHRTLLAQWKEQRETAAEHSQLIHQTKAEVTKVALALGDIMLELQAISRKLGGFGI